MKPASAVRNPIPAMPLVTRWFIKTGIIYLVAGVVLLLIDSAPFLKIVIPLQPVYWHMIAIGWISQLIIGVSIWMFPRKRRERRPDQKIPWIIYVLLNTGLAARFFSEPFMSVTQAIFNQWLIWFSVLFQLTAAALFVFEIWPRLKSKKVPRQR